MDYSAEIKAELKKKGVKIGDGILVEKDGRAYEGVLMPKSQGAASSLIVKLSNGYNVGVDFDKNTKIKASKGDKDKKKREKLAPATKYKPDPGKPTIAILSTGGTIASRIDYKTGAVTPLETAEEIVSAIPEILNVANIKMRPVFQMASDDMRAFHWITLAKKIEDEINAGADGIIITHGTDTMHYTSAALSLMVQGSPIPILVVGSQRSSDRGSSDAAFNLLCAAQFVTKSDFSGVAICMHGTSDDKFSFIHQGTHVRKMHTSRRDTFRSIDILPYAKVEPDGTIEWLRTDYKKRDKKRKPHVVERYEEKVALVKIYPGFDYRILEFYEKAGYRGVVIEGTGLGHAPINVTDDATKDHAKLLEAIKRMASSGIIIGMTSQCAYGKVNMNVYRPQRILTEAGVLELKMTPETALIKMGWALGHTKNSEDAKKILLSNVTGEILERVEIQAFE